MICSSYDAYMLEEDGQIEMQLYREYVDLNLSNPPKFVWVTTNAQAKELLDGGNSFDLIINMFNTADTDVFRLSAYL